MRRRSRARPQRAAARLQRLRIQLTLLFVVASSLGLVVLAVVAIGIDARLRADRLDASLRVRVQAASHAVYYEEGTLHLEGVRDDSSLAEGEPNLYVLEAAAPGGEIAVAYAPPSPDFSDLDLAGIAKQAVDARDEVAANLRADGSRVRAVALPFYDGNTPRGALVAVTDPAPGAADHRRLALTVWLASAALITLSTLGGYLLAGQSTRPAARALGQQEQFLADAAHELRTPIAALRAIIEGGLAGDEAPRLALERAAPTAVRATALLDDLLTLARIDSDRVAVRKEPVRLDLLVEEALTDHDSVVLHAEPSVVDGDPALLRRAVLNLVENAERHGRRLNASTSIEVSVRDGRVVVADRGPGLEPGLEPHLFERFRSGRYSGGAGLGLAIGAWIAGVHNGRLEGANRPDGGAIFTLTLSR